jgi:putative spermidine/putrescine transport system permease protein
MIARVIAIAAALFLLIPILVVIPMSFSTAISFEFPPPGYWLGYYRAFFTSSDWHEATMSSLLVALVTTVLTLGLAIPASFAFVRQRFSGKALTNLVIMSPLAVPQVVTALGYYGFLSRLGLSGTYTGLVIAHTAMALPVTFLVLCATLKGFDRSLERAAMMSGAGPLRTFTFVTFPVLRQGIGVGALFAFLFSFNEAVVAIFIAGRDTTTLPKRMFESIRVDSDPTIAVVSTIFSALVMIAFALFALTRRKSTYAA